ncbi:unnamed protein product [Arabis nemorensis]|uniref:Uncharacterized protein n=1 Tax=Arabis nemorensis TaxID=586526 RepID=A0A565C120_9BRAS|nr:unnamed protein product [Arabis nemorensis]
MGEDLSLSSLLLNISSITGLRFNRTESMAMPEFSSFHFLDNLEVGGLFDSLTGSIGISSRAKTAPIASSSSSGTATTGAAAR